ncbi:hypothetical protein AB0A73_21705 [Glycomyces sp. NPDC047369]
MRMALSEHSPVDAEAPRARDVILSRLRDAAVRLGAHPQDHGWRELYRLFAVALAAPASAPVFAAAAVEGAAARPESGDSHLVTVLGIALKTVCPDRFAFLVAPASVEARVAALEAIALKHGGALADMVRERQNSFTGARRFLVPQVLLAAMSRNLPEGEGLRLCDLGTGLGLMPRQLNTPELFERFAADLPWPHGVPAYRPIRLESRRGVDRDPLPDEMWVTACHGASSYYRVILDELQECVSHPQVRTAPVAVSAVDLLDVGALRSFLAGHRISAVTLTYTLYQLAPTHRAQVLDVLSDSLALPGIVVVIEPDRELSAQGCSVTVTEAARGRRWRVAHVSDGHFIGRVSPLEDFDAFAREFPIPVVNR